MPYFGQELFLQAQAKGPLTTRRTGRRWTTCRRLSRAAGIDAVMAKHRLDALVAPTGNPAWPTDLVNGDHFTGSSSTPAAVAGYPSISVPMGFAGPAGQSLVLRAAWSEPTLIRIGLCIRADNHASEAAAIPSDPRLTLLLRPWIFHPGSHLLQPGPAWLSPVALATDSAARAGLSRDQLLDLYYWMRLTRSLEERLVNLYRQTKVVGGLFRSLGQEA